MFRMVIALFANPSSLHGPEITRAQKIAEQLRPERMSEEPEKYSKKYDGT